MGSFDPKTAGLRAALMLLDESKKNATNKTHAAANATSIVVHYLGSLTGELPVDIILKALGNAKEDKLHEDALAIFDAMSEIYEAVGVIQNAYKRLNEATRIAARNTTGNDY